MLSDQEQWVYDLTVDEVHNFIADGVVVSNCHHSPSDSYQRVYEWICEHNPDVKHVGLTATPWRRDGKWSTDVFQEMPKAAQKNIRWGIKHGWLVPPVGTEIQTEVFRGGMFAADLSKVGVSAGDFKTGELADVLDAAKWHMLITEYYLEQCVEPYGEPKELVGDAVGKQAIAFTPTVLGSKKLCEELKSRGVQAAHVDGTMSQRQRKPIERAFQKGDIQVLTNCAVYGEGADFPNIEVVLMGRPTKSPGLLTQIVGRGLRPYPGKEHCDVYLFAGHGTDIMTLFDLGKSKKLKQAEKKAEELGVPGVSTGISIMDDSIDGMGTVATLVSLFGGSRDAWFRDGSTFSLSLGESGDPLYQRTLVILPPNGDDDWHLIGLGRSITYDDKRRAGQWKIYEISSSPDIEEMMDLAAEVSERRSCDVLTKKNKKWRKDPASPGQLKYLKALGVRPPNLLGKGDAARMITHFDAIKQLRIGGYVS